MEPQINDLLIELCSEIKRNPCYREFKEAAKLLDKPDNKLLLEEYQRILTKNQELRKYQKYIDIENSRKELKQIRMILNANPDIRVYYQKYHALNDYLSQLTTIIFQGISEDLRINELEI